jgi:hypothetical protein
MSLKKTIPIALVPHKNSQASTQTRRSSFVQNPVITNHKSFNSSSNNFRSQDNKKNLTSSPKVDSTVEYQITNLINSIISPKISSSPYNCLLIPIEMYQTESLDILKKHMLVPKSAKDLFLGYARDADVLILSPFLPDDLNVFDSISNNNETLSSHTTLSMQFSEFRGKLDLVLETLKIAANVTIDNSYQERIEEILNSAKTDIMFNWKRMEDLKRYGTKLVVGIRDGILHDLDNRITTGDVDVEEIGVVIQTMEVAFEDLKEELNQRYSNIQMLNSFNLDSKIGDIEANGVKQLEQQIGLEEDEKHPEAILEKDEEDIKQSIFDR